MLSRPATSNLTSLGTHMHMKPFTHDAYKETCIEDEDLKEGDDKDGYHFHNKLLYNLDKLYVPKGERLQLIKEAHAFKVAGHFGVGKTVANLQRYVY
jgi:hypothetical protein